MSQEERETIIFELEMNTKLSYEYLNRLSDDELIKEYKERVES